MLSTTGCASGRAKMGVCYSTLRTSRPTLQMASLARSNIGTRHTTMPLMTDADSDNFLRNAFNDRLREWTRQNGRVLFDIADIETHDPNGKPCTFQYRNKTYQKLCDSYTKDGGHLNEAGRQLVAKGFSALAAAVVEKQRTPALSVER